MNKQKIRKGTTKRLLRYVTQNFKKLFIIVFICIVFSSVANSSGPLFLQRIIDDYIIPLLGEENPVYTGLLKMIGIMTIIYLIGVICTFLYNRIMTVISQGVLKKIRDEMFDKMEKLPIRYFDTHSHGDIMSHYTNDTDTLRQMISQSLPMLISSVMTLIAIFIAMLYLNPIMALLVVFFTFLIVLTTKFVAGKSSKHFINQQKSLGEVDGFIEEMLNGQKVIKVFTHEEKAKEEFDKLNDKLNYDMYKANKYANIMGSIAINLGNLQYVLIAIVGTVLTLNGTISLTVGTLISFLQLTRHFAQPINQIMNNLNSVILALAGAGRIFEMMDEEPEKDEGYVTLVNAKKVDGKIVETEERTGMWAWKHPHHDGTLTYVELKGHIE